MSIVLVDDFTVCSGSVPVSSALPTKNRCWNPVLLPSQSHPQWPFSWQQVGNGGMCSQPASTPSTKPHLPSSRVNTCATAAVDDESRVNIESAVDDTIASRSLPVPFMEVCQTCGFFRVDLWSVEVQW